MAIKGDNMMSVKRSNRNAILKLLHENGALSRKMIAQELGLTPAAITLIVTDMMKDGLLSEGLTLPGSGAAGRKEILVSINSRSYYSLGASIDLNNAVLSATDLEGRLIFHRTQPFRFEDPPQETVRMLSRELLALVQENNIPADRITGLGVAIRGLVDVEKRVSVQSLGAFGVENLPLADLFEKETGLTVCLDNNVRSLSQAHSFMARGDKTPSQFFVRCETGIGGAMTIDHKLHNGSNGRCSELGHIPIAPNGKLCHCGKRGCLETIASPWAIEEDAQELLDEQETPVLYKITGGSKKSVTLKTVMEAAQKGDVKVKALVENAVNMFSFVLKGIIYMIDPQQVVLYGRLFENDYYLKLLFCSLKNDVDRNVESIVRKSNMNMMLNDNHACILAIQKFIDNGGILQE